MSSGDASISALPFSACKIGFFTAGKCGAKIVSGPHRNVEVRWGLELVGLGFCVQPGIDRLNVGLAVFEQEGRPELQCL